MATQTQNKEEDCMTVENYLYGCVNFPIPEESIKKILWKRGIDFGSGVDFIESKYVELCEADLYAFLAIATPSRIGSTTDKDNNWEHSDGGYTLSKDDKLAFLNRANVIYAKYDEPRIKKSLFKVVCFGSNGYNKPVR